jgi:outer membrane lipoprotein-sorting protein
MKRPFLLLCIAAIVTLFAPAAPAQSPYTLEQVFAKMDAVAKTFRSAQADVERTKVTVIVNDRDVSSGKFYYVRQGSQPRVRMDLTKPALQQLVIDKGLLQIYTPNLKQVQQASLAGKQDKVEMFMALGFGQSSQDLQKNFGVSLAGEEVINGKKTTVLDLAPKNSSMFKSVKLWMDQEKWVSVQVNTTEAGGDYMILKFSNIKLNSNISDSTFNLKLPKDVQVLKF